MQFTTLIPAYKPQYLFELLTALRHQTVKPARVLIADDSPDQSFIAALTGTPLAAAVADLNVQVVPGARSGAYNNVRHLLALFRQQPTEMFHLLLDDDIPYPTFYERHLEVHALGVTTCVVSQRWTALESGQPRGTLSLPEAITRHPQRVLSLDAAMMFEHLAAQSRNWLGEFSNATFRAMMADEVAEARLAGISLAGLEDLGAFLLSSLHAPIGFVNEFLGYFRTSPTQHSAHPMGRPLKLAYLAYVALALAGERVGQIHPDRLAASLERLCPLVMHNYGGQADMAEILPWLPGLARREPEAEAGFLRAWEIFSDDAVHLANLRRAA